MEKQSDHTINFLDLTISNHNDTLDCSIFRKPIATDTIIHNASCHPNGHKRAAIRNLNNRVNTYMVSEENKKQEEDIIETILQNNDYHTNRKLSYSQLKTSTNRTVSNKGKKHITFTYHGLAARLFTKLFRNTELKIAYKTKNTLRSHLQTKTMGTNKYELS
jgi:hypothetical protein